MMIAPLFPCCIYYAIMHLLFIMSGTNYFKKNFDFQALEIWMLVGWNQADEKTLKTIAVFPAAGLASQNQESPTCRNPRPLDIHCPLNFTFFFSFNCFSSAECTATICGNGPMLHIWQYAAKNREKTQERVAFNVLSSCLS